MTSYISLRDERQGDLPINMLFDKKDKAEFMFILYILILFFRELFPTFKKFYGYNKLKFMVGAHGYHLPQQEC
jgi:hypothetical protein